MAVTQIQENNKLVVYTRQINREFVRENLFSPYMGAGLNSIIRIRQELRPGGEQMNIPLVTRLRSKGRGVGTLVGNEEKVDNYGMRVWLDWCRHAVVTNKAEQHKDSTDLFGEFRPLLSDWAKEIKRDEIIEAFMALPSESTPANFGGEFGDRVNGIRYEAATAAQRNTWNAANSDRVLYGNAVANYNATHATALLNVDATNDRLVKGSISLMKRRAMNADPNIRPFKVADGYEHFVCFAGTNTFRDLKASLDSVNQDARPRDVGKNPIFQDGDLLYDGVIIRQVPEISTMVTDVWTTLTTAGDSSGRVEPVFFCGQQAMAVAYGQMVKPTQRKEDDFGFIQGVGIEAAYGIAKMFKKHPNTGTALKQWGVLTAFMSAPLDA